MKRTAAIHTIKTTFHLPARVLSALAAVALLAAVAPSNVRAGDDSNTPVKHVRRHESARLRQARHVHYVSDPKHEAPTVVPVRVIGNKGEEGPLDPTLYRSFQENNLLNPG